MAENTVAFIGNPNCGKTTLFNILTGSNLKVGNWPGVTVEKMSGEFTAGDRQFEFIDLPGIYSLESDTADQKIARDFLLDSCDSLIFNVVDSTNIERNLYLSVQLLEMGLPVVILLNMTDLAEKKGIRINESQLSLLLGCPVLKVSAVDVHVTSKVTDLLATYEPEAVETRNLPSYQDEIENFISSRESALSATADRLKIPTHWLSLLVLLEDEWARGELKTDGVEFEKSWTEEIKGIESLLNDKMDTILADRRYGFIKGLLKKVREKSANRRQNSEKIDSVVMNPLLGVPVFFLVMYLVFWVTMSLGGAFIDFFDTLFGGIFVDGTAALLSALRMPGWVTLFLSEGIGGGIQTVSTFIPVIFCMFFMLALLEDSGYMARAAFLMDKFLSKLGLPGKAFVPLIVGFGCTVPAIMGTRTLDSRRDKFMTIFMAPFMSCGARLPVYALFSAAFFGKTSGAIVFSIYMIGIMLAVLTGFILKQTLFKMGDTFFIMELPPYHLPRLRHILKHSWLRLRLFVFKAGKIIILAVTLLTLLNSLPMPGKTGDSILSSIGKGLTPVFSPMGIEEENWPATVGLFSGIFAKEAIVGTLNSLYGIEEGLGDEAAAFSLISVAGDALQVLGDNLRGLAGGLLDPLGLGIIEETQTADNSNIIFTRLKTYFTPWSAYAYMLFVLIYFPCVAALGAAFKEMGRLLGTIQVLYLTLLAWSVSTLFYQAGEGHSLLAALPAILILAVLYGAFRIISGTGDYINE